MFISAPARAPTSHLSSESTSCRGAAAPHVAPKACIQLGHTPEYVKNMCIYIYICESEILSDLYVPCWYWGGLPSLTTTGDSQLRHDGCFLGGPAVVLEPKGQQWWPFGTGRIRTIYMGTLWCCSLAPIRTPHAWPTSLITRKGVALNRSVTFAGIHLSNYGELKAHSELQIYDAACYDLYQKNLFTCTLTRCILCTALRFIRSGVASMESHPSMEIKSKHEDDYGARSLPSRSFVSWDVDRCRNSAFHAMTFKKRCGSQLAGSDSSQKSFAMKKR